MTPPAPTPRRALQALGSVYFALTLLIVGIVVLAVGGIIESRASLEFARSAVYRTFWFDLYLLLLGVNLIAAVVNRLPIQRHQWAFVLTHFAIVSLLIGAWISRSYGFEGQAIIEERGISQALLLNGAVVTLSEPAREGAEYRFELSEAAFLAGEVLQDSTPERPRIEILDYLPSGLAHVEPQGEAEGGPASSSDAEPRLRLKVGEGGEECELWLSRGASQSLVIDEKRYSISYRRAHRPLPFSIQLDEFLLRPNPGGDHAPSYESHLTLRDLGADPITASTVVAMNHPIDFHGFRISQSGFELGEGGEGSTTVLHIAHDPGVPIIYTAFILLILGVAWYFLGGGRPRRGGTQVWLVPAARTPKPVRVAIAEASEAAATGSSSRSRVSAG